ncbi:MAG: hypothetical protein HRT82_16320 [Henriciella sp.]|nr:hypothetical protein [Henriciella sp.]
MALLNNTRLTLADNAKLMDPTGKMSVVANLLSQTNEILDDCVFQQANGKTFHRVSISTGLPEVYWTQVNTGTPPSKAKYANVDEGIGMLEARAETDIRAAKLSGNVSAYRMQQAMQHMEAMNQEMATTLFYGDTGVTSSAFVGFSGRYTNVNTAPNSQNVLSCLGNNPGVQQSIWLIGWGPQTIYCTYPEGSTAGLSHRDLGEDTAYFSDGTRMQVYADIFNWENGLVVKDWRYAVRIANIDNSHADVLDNTQSPDGPNYTNIIHRMIEAVARIPNLSMCRPAFYVNRGTFTLLQRLAMEKSANALSLQEGMSQFGTPRSFLTFMGIPIRRCDALTRSEDVVPN